MIRALPLAVAGVALWAGVAWAECRQALALGLDVSGSVDAREYRLQMDGLAAALDTPKVRAALLDVAGPPVALLVYEWSGPDDSAVILPWTDVTAAPVLDQIIERLQTTARREASPGTALGGAMMLGAAHLQQRRACWKLTLDLSGDGKSNLGARPRDVKDTVAAQGVTINALVIGADAPNVADLRQVEIGELSLYFRAEVIVGPDAFVETAIGFDDYAEAMARKLERELQTLILSDYRQ